MNMKESASIRGLEEAEPETRIKNAANCANVGLQRVNGRIGGRLGSFVLPWHLGRPHTEGNLAGGARLRNWGGTRPAR